MRTWNERLSIGAAAAAGITTSQVDTRHIAVATFQCVWSGGTPGVVTVQGSCDQGTGNPASITNWTDVTSATITPAGASGSGYIEVKDFGWAWLRVVCAAGGTGSLTITGNAKGV